MNRNYPNNWLHIPAVDPADAITLGERGTLITPADPFRQRFNIGIRSLGNAVNLAITLHDSAGNVVTSFTRSFVANHFQQFSFADLIGQPAGANQSVTFEVLDGSAIIYGTAIDNASGAMLLQLARGVGD